MELDRKHDLTIWAAFTAGHHLSFISSWQGSIWRCRLLYEEGKITEMPELPREAEELINAIEILAPALQLDALRAVQVGGWLGTWLSQCQEMLRCLPTRLRDETDIDWGSAIEPGLRQFLDLHAVVSAAIKEQPHWAAWFCFGERLFDPSACQSIPADLAAELCRSLQALYMQGQYDFIPPVIDVLKQSPKRRLVPDAMRDMLDPWLDEVTIRGLVSHLRNRLRQGARPVPTIVLARDSVLFYRREFKAVEFRAAEWRILRLLCKNPRKDLERQFIIREARLDCQPKSVASHMSRLRKKLWPAVQAHFRGTRMPEYAAMCFIIGTEPKDEGPYALEVESVLVSDVSKAKDNG